MILEGHATGCYSFLLSWALFLLGIVATCLLSEFIWNVFTVSVQFSDMHYGNFQNIKTWLGSQLKRSCNSNGGIKSKEVRKLFRFSYHVWGRFTTKTTGYGKKSKLVGDPTWGSTFFLYKGCLFRIVFTPKPKVRSSTCSTATIRISTFKWNSEVINALLLEALRYGIEGGKENKTTIFGISESYGAWHKLGNPKPLRTASSVFLAAGQVEFVINDIKAFIDSANWYEVRNVPHRRGYLLYGPPGCGKTSIVRAIAGEFKQDICSLSLSSKGLTDDCLIRYLNTTPANTLILIEDVDCAFKARGDYDATLAETNLVLSGASGSAVTFRGLLNALDGVASCDGKIVFLTTNHPEKLDPALTRPGRIDVKVLIDYPDNEQLGRFFNRFYPEAGEKVKEEFLENITSLERKVSMAMVQGLFLMYKEKAEDALDGFQDYFQEQFKIMPKVNDVNANLYM